jgi:hypothetical protein
MKKLVTMFIAMFIIAIGYAQSDVRKVENFSELSLKNAFEVILTKGDVNEVKITSENSENLEKVITEVSQGKLCVYNKKGSKTKGSITVFITYKNLLGIENNGATEISAKNAIKSDKFYLKGSGASEVTLDFDVKELTIDYSGASELKLKGSTNDLGVALSGASELSASNLKSKTATIDISGASDVKIYATESIEGKTSGASSVKVNGGASVDKIKSSGISSISKG